MRVKISDILKATGGKLLCGDEAVAVTSFFTDSRQAKAGAMFVPIRGERADGHDYIPAVLESPAAATFTDHEIPLGEKPIVLVKDCREALQKAAAWYREQFAIPVVGLIMMIYWSLCGSKWEERQKLATACMIKRLVGDLVILALLIAAHSVIVGLSYMPILLGGMGY